MKYLLFLVPLLSIALLAVVLVAISAWGSRKYQQQKTNHTKSLQQALSIIISCNTYPKMLTVFTRLEANLKKYGIEVKDNFGGYFKNG